jgi:hypothetical protein
MNHRRRSPLLVAVAVAVTLVACNRNPPPPERRPVGEVVRGQPIASTVTTNSRALATNAAFVPADFSKPDVVKDGLVQLSWQKLSGFKFDVYEVYSETNMGRALVKSDDTIPEPLKAYDGRRVSVSGFILPLRTRKGMVTEFLLLRDQGTCCFGAQAQINHFMRVKYPPGIKVAEPVAWKVSGTIRVGEVYTQGYLAGIYQFEAETAVEVK